jgi:hypothetical protein
LFPLLPPASRCNRRTPVSAVRAVSVLLCAPVRDCLLPPKGRAEEFGQAKCEGQFDCPSKRRPLHVLPLKEWMRKSGTSLALRSTTRHQYMYPRTCFLAHPGRRPGPGRLNAVGCQNDGMQPVLVVCVRTPSWQWVRYYEHAPFALFPLLPPASRCNRRTPVSAVRAVSVLLRALVRDCLLPLKGRAEEFGQNKREGQFDCPSTRRPLDALPLRGCALKR